jgi:hypothetical protein
VLKALRSGQQLRRQQGMHPRGLEPELRRRMPRPSAAMLLPANDGTTGPPPTRAAWYFTICAALISAAADPLHQGAADSSLATSARSRATRCRSKAAAAPQRIVGAGVNPIG